MLSAGTSGESPLHLSTRSGLNDSSKGSSAELELLKFLPDLAKTDGRRRDGKTRRPCWLKRPGVGFLTPLVLKLCGLPADLPRNLASFSPSVDDRNGGGSGPRGLRHHRWVLWWNGSGTIRVLIVCFNGRFQRRYGGTCGKKKKHIQNCVEYKKQTNKMVIIDN